MLFGKLGTIFYKSFIKGKLLIIIKVIHTPRCE
jgi:hypothetical protein